MSKDGILHLTLPSKPRSRIVFGERDISFYHQGLENFVVRYDRCLNKFRDYVEE
jgi:hypothetical protein